MKKLFSPLQIAFGAVLGGPIAAVFFLKTNFDTLDRVSYSDKTIKLGTILTFCLLLCIPFIPEHFPKNIIAIAYLLPVVLIIKKYQLSKVEIQDASDYDFQSNWKVLSFSLVCLIAFLIVAISYTLALASIGLVRLG